MRCRAVAGALLALSLSSAAGESVAPAGASLNATATAAGTPLAAAVGQTRRAPVAQTAPDASAEPQNLRPWLLILTGVVLIAMMARRRL